jgi:uncharacterized repeat protein (TIGR03803 family)
MQEDHVTSNKFYTWAAALILTLGGVAESQTFTQIYSFGAAPDANNPQSTLIPDGSGGVYGTTFYGGANGYGAIFHINSSGAESVAYSFTGPPDGANPAGVLARDSAGNLYGTTEWGGADNYGSVFKLSSSGEESVLHSFAGGGSDGANPEGGLIADSAGNLYGTTAGAGSGTGCGIYGCGTVFKLDTDGTETVLYMFSGDTAGGTIDGANPWCSLLRDSAGNLYGTTVFGGTAGFGTIFKLDASGTETLLHSFVGVADGAYPYAGLTADGSGNLWGVAYQGGSSHVGTIFEMSKGGKTSSMYSFLGGLDGGLPTTNLVRDKSGNFYGTTTQGGADDDGTVFELSAQGTETALHAFTGGKNGLLPEGGLIIDASGQLLGTTYYGGSSNNGTVFRVTP